MIASAVDGWTDRMPRPCASHSPVPKCMNRSTVQNLQSGGWKPSCKSLTHSKSWPKFYLRQKSSQRELCCVLDQKEEVKRACSSPPAIKEAAQWGHLEMRGAVGWCLIQTCAMHAVSICNWLSSLMMHKRNVAPVGMAWPPEMCLDKDCTRVFPCTR